MLTATKFELDEAKMLKSYTQEQIDEMYKYIDEVAKEAELTKIEKGYYECDEDNSPANMGLFVFRYMVRQEWFTKNLKSWLWFEDGELDGDIIEVAKKHSKGVWE